ncbi:flagellin [Endozoicomonas sp. OPT23]|uniref:flagellin N-terminal helical domain-containing protein n=1 Tax=Endozoicomonas sp. OPT23 TaxID=2072845 RepID=UPI00129BA9E3|nr:flagellin [Endozoicomonas sp. OPT23]MRI33920.1 flagellin [Endozoicomonas sp. OPT23]
MISINSNASAMMARNNLYTSQNTLQDSMLKLSTGKRINSASDDAAGMQISNRMATQMNGLGVAQRNANDAISMAQTAEGAMQEDSNIMNRMRDLALQSANDSNTAKDRGAMQKEIGALVTEIDRISDTTNFAGIKLLDGNSENMSFQIGSNASETISFGVKDMGADKLGTDIQKIDSSVGITNKKTDGETVTIGTESVVIKAGESLETAASQLNKALSAEKIDAKAVVTEAGGIEYVGSDAGLDAAMGSNVTGTGLGGVNGISLNNKEGAQKAAIVLDSALAQVDEQRADLGAVQNRLESTVSNLSNIEENMGVSQNRILNTDFAKETVSMTSSQMLMQAGSTILAQAKALPQNAIRLLG